MADFKIFTYLRLDPHPIGIEPKPLRGLKASDLAATRAHLNRLRNMGFDIHRRNAYTERASAAVAASGRPELKRLLRKLGPRTELAVMDLDALGRNATDVLKTVLEVKARGAQLYCIPLKADDVCDDQVVMTTLESLARLEQSAAKTSGAAIRKGRGVKGGRIGRPPALDERTRAKVRERLTAGETVSELARRYDTSRQTILRVRDAEK